MNKRQKEIIESCNNKKIDNNIIKDKKLKVVFNDNIELIYLENKDMFDEFYQNSYKIMYTKGENYQEILIDIFRFSNKLMVGKIDLNSRKNKIGSDVDVYSKVTIEQFLDKAVVKGRCGNTIYQEPYYNTDMLFEVIMDYLNSTDIYNNNNNEIKSLFYNITKFIIEDIDSIFKNMDKEAINQIRLYENELDSLEKYYSSRKNIIKQKIKKFNTITKK